jgi:hypothetical protein
MIVILLAIACVIVIGSPIAAGACGVYRIIAAM